MSGRIQLAVAVTVWFVLSSGVPAADAPRAAPVVLAAETTSAPTPRPTPPPPPPDGPATFVDDLPPDAVEIAATGDVNLGARVGELIRAHGPSYPWEHVSGLLRTADVTLVNLECAMSTRGSPLDKEYTFRGDPSAVPAMAEAGVDVANLGNNHAADFGREALVDTLGHLRAAGIAAVGAGRNTDEAYRHVVVERSGLRIAFLGATRVLPYHFGAGSDVPGVASAYEEARLISAVRAADGDADVTVVSIHWGVELAPEPNDVQIGLGRALVDAGADVVIGHHPHVLQPVVRYRGAVIAYSLGNFVFASGSVAGTTTMLLRVGVLPDTSLVVARVPMRIVGARPQPAQG